MVYRSFFIYSFLFLISFLQADWLPLQRLSLPEHKAIFPNIVIDSEGNQTAVWQGCNKNHSIIQAAAKPFRGEWQEVPNRLSLGEEEVGLPQVVVDKAGRVIVVWDQFDGKNFIIHASTKSPEGKWQSIPDEISPKGESAFNPRLAVDFFGNVTVVWEKFDGKHFVIQAATKREGEPWQIFADSLSFRDENACFPQVVADFEGNVTALWHQCGKDNVTKIFACYKPYGGNWQKVPDSLSWADQDAFDLQAAVDSFGCVSVVWNGGDGTIWFNQKQREGGWQPAPNQLSCPGGKASSPHLAVGSLGHVNVIWSELQGGGSTIQYAMKKRKGNWQKVSRVFSHPDRKASHPRLAMNEKGDVCLVWCEKDGDHDRVCAMTKAYKGEWKRESDFLSPAGHHALFPCVVFHPNGMPVVTWQQFVHQEVFIQVAEKLCLLPPRDLTGKVICQHLSSSTEYLHSLKWKKSLSSSVDHYLLFQNDRPIAKISKNKKLRWLMRYQSKTKQQIYQLVAVNREGWESPPIKIVLSLREAKKKKKESQD